MGDVVWLHEIGRGDVGSVGGKGARLAELSQISGLRVPAAFCVTTAAFERAMSHVPAIDDLLDQLSVALDDRKAIAAVSAQLRRALGSAAIPGDVQSSIRDGLASLGAEGGYAVRSSATAEDSPGASFAGQHDSYLNVVGEAAVLEHVRRCWASLYSVRAVSYRLQRGVDHRDVSMGVVVQRMVPAEAAGVLLTADPVTSNRKVASVEAVFGLGEALVAGLASADTFTVRDGQVVAKTVAAKSSAIDAAAFGGPAQQRPTAPGRHHSPALSDPQVVRLVGLGRRIEAHFGCPQDIEWCLVDDDFSIVQARPITTLFPVPDAGDGDHVYVSVGHQQMMTDPLKPLGLSAWQLTSPRPMYVAGGRLFVDVAPDLASPATRANVLGLLGRSDPRIGEALRTILERDDVRPALADTDHGEPAAAAAHAPIDTDPAVVAELIARSEASLAALKHDISKQSGQALIEFIMEDLRERQRAFDPRSYQVIFAAVEASWWLTDRLQEWLGEGNAADTLTQSVPHNVTSEMGLALLEVADVIRPHGNVVTFLHHVVDDGAPDHDFLKDLAKMSGGREARDAIEQFLDRYGMRCVGEIDITRPRWSEHPATLVAALLGNIEHFEEGAGAARFERGRQEAWNKEQEILERLRALPDGMQKADEAKRMIDRVRTFAGYREYPKYALVSRYWVYKQALMAEAERLTRAGVLREPDDIFHLTLPELRDVVGSERVDEALIDERKRAFTSYQQLTPPRVLTSDGEVITGEYRHDDLPTGALAGFGVSAGAVEGRARVILDIAVADLAPGDILVTTYTDPSWTPLFVAIDGLVTEVGGLTTHGAVIAREYGVPAVVGVDRATQRIRDGQRIRVHGTDGYVEILPDETEDRRGPQPHVAGKRTRTERRAVTAPATATTT